MNVPSAIFFSHYYQHPGQYRIKHVLFAARTTKVAIKGDIIFFSPSLTVEKKGRSHGVGPNKNKIVLVQVLIEAAAKLMAANKIN